jgi:predicted dehydrogenase
MNKKIKMGLVGGGPGSFIGPVHFRAAIMDGHIELVCGAFDSDPVQSKASAEIYGISPKRAYGTWEEMFEKENSLPESEKMDMVAVTTPNHLHFPISMKALENGFHVVCEKPVTISHEEAQKLAAKVDDSGLLFALTPTYTGYPMVKEAKHLVSGNQLGTIRKIVVEYPQGWLSTPLEKTGNQQAEWRSKPEFNGPGGCLGDIGVHAENLAEYITGLQIDALCADINSFVPGRALDDDASVLLRFEGGARGVLWATQIAAGEENNLTIRVYGEKGGLEWRQHDPNTLLLKMLDQPVQILRAGVNYSNLSEIARWNLRVPGGHPEGYIEAFANIYKNMAHAIQQRNENLPVDPAYLDFPTVHDGVRGMRFIEKVIESARSSEKWIKFQG